MDGLAAMEKENLSPRISTPSPDEQGWSREHSMSTSDSARGTDLSAITSPDVAPADTVAEISCQAADNDPPPADNSQSAAPAAESDKARLLRLLKRDVKTLMEEATIRHVIHEHSSYVNSLCASIEACLSHGLRKRVFGLFGTGTTFALLHKIAKLCPAAATVLKLVLHMQQNEFKQTRESSENRSSSMGESLRGILPSNFMSGGGQGGVSGSGACSPANDRYMWIRVALAQKLLVNIADFVAKHAHRYYEKEALMADPVHGHMVASLLVAPCALDYTKVKSYDSYLTDPPAGELVQRHRIHSSAQYNRSLSISTDQQQSVDTGLSSAISTPGGSAAIAAAPCGAPVEPAHCATPRGGETTFSPTRGRPSLQVSRNPSVGANLDELGLSAGAPASGRQCVNSLHQNTRSSLLYGKNNVSVCPVGGRELMRGYLSLHQNSNGTLCIKWTPNELMRGGSEHAVPPSPRAIGHNRSVLWRHALSINVADIIYMHYHSQRADSSGSVVFVGADGVQYPPLHFPAGQHPLQFLSCLENGLLPWGQLDPPLWLHRGKGKILPRLRRRSSVTSLEGSELPGSESTHSISDKADGGTDLVFRIMPIVPLDSCLADRTASSIDQSSRCTSGTAPIESDRSANLIALSNLSSLLKTRFMSVGSSPASSPPSTPRVWDCPQGQRDQLRGEK